MERGRDRERERDGGREKDRKMYRREKHPVLVFHMHPNRGSHPQPFGVEGQRSNKIILVNIQQIKERGKFEDCKTSF